ncbi:MAG: hypothetical protein WC222_08550 [Parachlamydiales bacterium]|jgi:hypothetical protein
MGYGTSLDYLNFFIDRHLPDKVREKLNVYKDGLLDKIKIAICKLISLKNKDYSIIPVLKFKGAKSEDLPKVQYATKERIINYTLNIIHKELDDLGFKAPAHLEFDLLRQISLKEGFHLQGFINRYLDTAHLLKREVLVKRYTQFCEITKMQEDWAMFNEIVRHADSKSGIELIWESITTRAYNSIPTVEEYLEKADIYTDYIFQLSEFEGHTLVNTEKPTFDPDTKSII